MQKITILGAHESIFCWKSAFTEINLTAKPIAQIDKWKVPFQLWDQACFFVL